MTIRKRYKACWVAPFLQWFSSDISLIAVVLQTEIVLHTDIINSHVLTHSLDLTQQAFHRALCGPCVMPKPLVIRNEICNCSILSVYSVCLNYLCYLLYLLNLLDTVSFVVNLLNVWFLFRCWDSCARFCSCEETLSHFSVSTLLDRPFCEWSILCFAHVSFFPNSLFPTSANRYFRNFVTWRGFTRKKSAAMPIS